MSGGNINQTLRELDYVSYLKKVALNKGNNKQEIEQLKFEAEKAEREGDYGKVAEIRYGKLQALENEIKDYSLLG